jgi:hypothetical protein
MARLKDFFDTFINDMDSSIVYEPTFFMKEYNIKLNVVHYYLQKAVYNKELCMVKIRNRTFFLHRKHYQIFKEFNKLKHVRVL